jgi:dolichol-phosphate mannosyltransferase
MSKASDFKLLDRAVVDTLVKMPERNAFFRALSSWVGYKTTQVVFDVQQREEGKSKWSAMALIKYAVTNIAAFSAVPMQLVTLAGVLTLIFCAIMGIQTLVNYFSGRAIEGFTTVILLLLFIGSVIMISLGIIGYYVARIYDEIKGRPKYIVSATCRSKEKVK